MDHAGSGRVRASRLAIDDERAYAVALKLGRERKSGGTGANDENRHFGFQGLQ